MENFLRICLYISIISMGIVVYSRARGSIRSVLYVVTFFVAASVFVVYLVLDMAESQRMLVAIAYSAVWNGVLFAVTNIFSKRNIEQRDDDFRRF